MKKVILILSLFIVISCSTEPEGRDNFAPSIARISVNSTYILIAETCSLTVYESDLDLDIISYNWSSSSGTFSDSTQKTVVWTAPEIPGIYEIKCTVSDGKEADEDSVDIYVSQTGNFKGYVYNDVTKDFIPDAVVTVDSFVYLTNESGYFEIADIPLGWWNFNVEAQGYFDHSDTIFVDFGLNTRDIYLEYPQMVFVPAGEFLMGDNFNEGQADERPVHSVYLDNYYIGKYEVTNREYCRFLNETGNKMEGGSYWLDLDRSDIFLNDNSRFEPDPGRDKYPVYYVTWYGARAYCAWLSVKMGETYRLPTEAEWEKAARGTDQRRFPWGDGIDPTYASYRESTGNPFNDINPVGFYNGTTHGDFTTSDALSPYGAYDMAGNVGEWCSDWYDENYYAECFNLGVISNPEGSSTGMWRVLRGGYSGSSAMGPYSLRSASRSAAKPDLSIGGYGFRVVKEN